MREIWGMVYTILIHTPMKGATVTKLKMLKANYILIHTPMKGATAKSHKIDSDFTVLFRKFI